MGIKASIVGMMISNAIRKEANNQCGNGTELSMMLSEVLERIADTIDDKLHSIDLEEREERMKSIV